MASVLTEPANRQLGARIETLARLSPDALTGQPVFGLMMWPYRLPPISLNRS
jgi:hypothetical protein